MKPTPAHFALWAYKNAPGWARSLKLPVVSDIHSIINAKAGKRPDSDRIKCNALSLMQLVRKNCRTGAEKRPLAVALAEIGRSDHPTNPINRRALFLRTAKRIEGRAN